MEGERSVTVFNYCIGARPIQSIIEKYKKQIENVLFVDDVIESDVFHVDEAEVAETIPLLNDNIQSIHSTFEMEGIRDNWKMTKQNYCRIDSTHSINYNEAVISAYAIGTTPIHVFLLRRLFTQYLNSIDSKKDINILCFCGGSGAELLAFLLSYQNQSNIHLHITIIDKEALWEKTIMNLKKTACERFGLTFTCDFVVMDLLDSSQYDKLTPYIQKADICTMVYGVSELLDYQPIQTEYLLQLIAHTMKEDSLFLFVDPLSHQFCCEKERQIESFFLHSNSSFTCQQKGHCKVSVSRSILEPAITTYCSLLHLQINRDVKLSCHVWFCLLHKDSITKDDSIIIINNPSTDRILILTQLACIYSWNEYLHQYCHTNTWQLRDSTEDQNHAIYTRLFHSWSIYGGVLLLPYSIFSSISHIQPLSPTLTILHNYDFYLETIKKKHSLSSSIFTSLQSFQQSSFLFHFQEDASKTEKGLNIVQIINKQTQSLLPSVTPLWESIHTSSIFQLNQKRGLDCIEKSYTWKETPVQEQMLDGLKNNNLRTIVLIHPSLVFDSKIINNRQFQQSDIEQLRYLAGNKEFNPSLSQRISICIDEINSAKQQNKKVVILCRLLPSMSIILNSSSIIAALEKCIEYSNSNSNSTISMSILHSFKKTQSKTQFKQTQLSFDTDCLLMHISCVPFMEMNEVYETIILFDSQLGENNDCDSNEAAISLFFHCNCTTNVTVIRL